MHIPIVHETHLHGKHAKTKESGGHATPKKIWKFGLSKNEFRSILTLKKLNTDNDET